MNRAHRFPNSSPERAHERRAYDGLWLPRGWIDGLIVSNDGTDATNDIGVSAGVCRSTVNIVDGAASTLTRDQIDLEIPVAIIKQLDVLFAPTNYDGAGRDGGTRSGMLSSTAITDTDWHILAVGKRGEPTDILAHNTFTQASILPELQRIGGYTAYRRIRTIRRATSIRLETQTGDFIRFKTPPRDINDSDVSTTADTYTLSVPTGVSWEVLLALNLTGTNAHAVYLRNTNDTDSAPSQSAAPLATIAHSNSVTAACQAIVQCDTSAQIIGRADAANAVLVGVTLGYWDRRDRNA